MKMGLKVNVSGLRFRATDRELGAGEQLRIIQKRLSNSSVIRLRPGDNPADGGRILSWRQPSGLRLEALGASETSPVEATVKGFRFAFPEMIDDPSLPFKVARDVFECSLKRDGDMRAAAINKEYGSNLRIPTEPELLRLNRVLDRQLAGRAYWIWTDTTHKKYPNKFVLSRRGIRSRYYALPVGGCSNSAVRFVEDK